MGWAKVIKVLVALVALSVATYYAQRLYKQFHPVKCDPKRQFCIKPYLSRHPLPKMKLWVYSSPAENPSRSDLTLLTEISNFKLSQKQERKITVTVLGGKKLYAHVFLAPSGYDPILAPWKTHMSSALTVSAIPEDTGEEKKENQQVSHWKPFLGINVMTDKVAFSEEAIPAQLEQYFVVDMGEYMPFLYLDKITCEDLLPLEGTVMEMPLTIVYTPISFSKLLLFTILKDSHQRYGFKEKDLCPLKKLNLFLTVLVVLVGILHVVIDACIFTNEISYWWHRDNMTGLSRNTMAWRCFSTGIIFLYLVDEQTSFPILIPFVLQLCVEVWKILKVFKVTLPWSGDASSDTDDQEEETKDLDSEITKFLLLFSCPVFIGVGVYSVLYSSPRRSWYSFCIKFLADEVYGLGFVMMLPQVFINYKLQSVAHLPWKAFLYKAANTFIDDIFAIFTSMPTTHRLACFRDDFVFIIYLFQRWLYPVDTSRRNEYGDSFEGSSSSNAKQD